MTDLSGVVAVVGGSINISAKGPGVGLSASIDESNIDNLALIMDLRLAVGAPQEVVVKSSHIIVDDSRCQLAMIHSVGHVPELFGKILVFHAMMFVKNGLHVVVNVGEKLVLGLGVILVDVCGGVVDLAIEEVLG